MRASAIIGIVLIVAGLLALAYGGFSYTDRETVLDVGPVEATAETEESVPIPPILGAGAVIGGIALVVLGMRKRV